MIKYKYLIIFFLQTIILSCTEGKQSNVSTCIIGTWQEINSEFPNFKMNDSTMELINSGPMNGFKFKYKIIDDTLLWTEPNSKVKIILLNNDSLITLDSMGITKYFIKIK